MNAAEIHDKLDFNNNVNHYIIKSPLTHENIKDIILNKYPNSTFKKINDTASEITSSDGKHKASINSDNNIHLIILKKLNNSLNESKHFNWTTHLDARREIGNKVYRPDDEKRLPVKSTSINTPYQPPLTHHMIVKTQHPLHMNNIHDLGNNHYAIPVTSDDYHKVMGLGIHNRSMDDNEIISNEAYRKRETPKHIAHAISKYLPNVNAEFVTARPSIEEPINDHYALLHVPANMEHHISSLKNIHKSPKGKYYVKVNSHVKQMSPFDAHAHIGDITGWHDINDINNPKRNTFTPNYDMSHAIRVDKILSPDDILRMKNNK